MNRSARRILIGVGVGLGLLLLLLVLVPVLFAGKISDRVKTELNRTLLARVDWSSAGLGFFHDFPNLTLTLDDFSIVGVGKFQGDTLAAIPRFRIVVEYALQNALVLLVGVFTETRQFLRFGDPFDQQPSNIE